MIIIIKTIQSTALIGVLEKILKLEDGNKRISREHLDNSVIKNGQNAKNSPRDLRILSVTQTPVRNH